MITMLQILSVTLLAPVVLVCVYHLFLALAGLWPRRRRAACARPGAHHFAIVIPAHNEEAGLATVLRSCAALDYPSDRYQVFVIADNCSDTTATVARQHGATCLERSDLGRRGKGYALEWAFERVLKHLPDAVLVLDADCTIDSHALREFNRLLQDGYPVLQASYVASNPDATVTSYVGCIANCIENELFYAPKSRLGLAVLLRGTGMVFARAVLERYPWNAQSIVEDSEYTVRLYQAGLRVEFVPNVRVLSPFAAEHKQLAIQRGRWIGGNSAFGWTHVGRLIGQGLLSRRPILIDLGWTLLASQRSIVLLLMLLALAVCALSAWLAPGAFSLTLLLVAACLPLAQGLLLVCGVARLGLSGRRLAFLAGSPFLVARWLLIGLRSVVVSRALGWERTPR